jgi:1-aminocyclopropane-1-carboxylate synthase
MIRAEDILTPAVGTRATEFIVGHKLPYVGRFFSAVGDQFNAVDNPQGKVALCVAENRLAHSTLAERVKSFPGFSPDVFMYTSPTGQPAFKETLCSFLNEFVFRDCGVNPDQITVAPGCCALLHQLAYLLFEPGDSVLVPTPFYAAFLHDFLNLGKVVVVDVNSSTEPSMSLTSAALDDAWERARTQGNPPKALLLTNPSNPLGAVYSDEQLLLAANWARSRGLHLIVDEIYALSVFSQQHGATPAFTSVAALLSRREKQSGAMGMGDHVHCLWSVSKDFGASGFRVGCLYSHSKPLLKALGSMNDMFQVSNLAQQIVGHVLADHAWVRQFLQESRERLHESYDVLCAGLESLPIPLSVVPAQAAIFAFCDFRPMIAAFAKANTPEAEAGSAHGDEWSQEEAFAQFLFNKTGIVLTPGQSCHCQVPGFFRVCYAWVTLVSLKEALRRLAALQEEILEESGEK